MRDWKLLTVVIDGEYLEIEGVNVWGFEWKDLDEKVLEVPHPSYPNQKHCLSSYFMETGGRRIEFAAGELSNCVWCFYVPA